MHALILSNGFPPSRSLLVSEVEKADILIGADGGGNIFLDHDIQPHVVVGDMDSFIRPDQLDFEILKDSGQETNDLEKALQEALNRESKSCTVLGAFGKRMDHSLKNLSVMKRYCDLFEILEFRDEDLKAFLVTSSYKGELPVGSIISLFPLSGTVSGIKTTGLKYPLKGEELKNGHRDGTSNENIERVFTIEVERGDLVVFIENQPDQ